MARFNDLKWTPQVLEAAEVWREKCFFADGSLFSDEKLWTLENVRKLFDCLKILQKQEGKFWDKLPIQMRGAEPDIIQLQAEVMWMLRLFPIGKKWVQNATPKF